MRFHHYDNCDAVSVIFSDGLEAVVIPGSATPAPLNRLIAVSLNAAAVCNAPFEDRWREVIDKALAAERAPKPSITVDQRAIGQLTLRLPKLQDETPAEAMVRAAALLGQPAPSLVGVQPLSLLIDDTGEGMPV